MALIIKSECIDIKDGSCAQVCPVDCIYEGARMFYIHPVECIECGLCESICPVDAIAYDDEASGEAVRFIEVNRGYFSAEVTALGAPGGWHKGMSAEADHPLVAEWPKQT